MPNDFINVDGPVGSDTEDVQEVHEYLETNNDGDDDNGPLVQAPDEQKLEPKKNKPAPSGAEKSCSRFDRQIDYTLGKGSCC